MGYIIPPILRPLYEKTQDSFWVDERGHMTSHTIHPSITGAPSINNWFTTAEARALHPVEVMAPHTLPLMKALGHSVSSGRFADTKIILYSRRDASGAISRPKALYANSHVLRSVPYFNDREFHFTLVQW